MRTCSNNYFAIGLSTSSFQITILFAKFTNHIQFHIYNVVNLLVGEHLQRFFIEHTEDLSDEGQYIHVPTVFEPLFCFA